MSCPCKECLKFPICKNRPKVTCHDLYVYFINTRISLKGIIIFEGYNDNVFIVEKMFGRYVSATSLHRREVVFTLNKRKRSLGVKSIKGVIRWLNEE